MHVLVIPSWYPDAPGDVKGVFFRDQVMALRDVGHQIGVIALSLKSLRSLARFRRVVEHELAPYESDDGIATYRKVIFAALPRVPYGNFWIYRHQLRKLVVNYIHEHGRPDIIHAHSALYAGAAAVSLGKILDIPVVITEHSSVYARGLYSSWQLKLAAKAYEDAYSCLCVSPALGKLLEKLAPATFGRWSWIPNVVAARFDDVAIKPPSDLSTVRFLNLAMMNENKGQSDLIKAFHEFQVRFPCAELVLGGDGPVRSDLENEVQSLGLSKKVHFIGTVPPEEVPQLMAGVDAMVIASHYETFGVVAAEALMAGLPVIATRCGGPESIVLEEDGELVSVGTPSEMASAMGRIAENLTRYDRLGIAARARGRFSGQAVAAALTQEYGRVVAERAGAGRRR